MPDWELKYLGRWKMPNTNEQRLEEALKQKVSEAEREMMRSMSQEIDAESQRDMIGARIYYENREAGERWLRMESQKPASSECTLRRHLKWDGDVLTVTDTVRDALHEASKKMEDAMVGEIVNHYNADLSDFREYLRDREEWRRRQEKVIPRWIPVTERLPETRRFVPHGPISSSKVLFKTSDKTMHLGYLIKDSYVDEYAGETILHRWYDDHGDRIENVTKWCEPPKEDDNA